MKKAATLGLVCLLVLVCALPAQAVKARGILTDSDSVYHANHLQQHLGTTSCICTGDYVGMRSSSSGSTVVGKNYNYGMPDGVAYLSDFHGLVPDDLAQLVYETQEKIVSGELVIEQKTEVSE